MNRRRSRAQTEECFVQAVLRKVAATGCADLGVNTIAQQAGFDKVLIYRYFGGLEGLFLRAVEKQNWLPSSETILAKLPMDQLETADFLEHIIQIVLAHLREEPASLQLLRWRHAVKNPLTLRFSQEWQNLWPSLAQSLSTGLHREVREAWERAFALIHLIAESAALGQPAALDLVAPLADSLPLINERPANTNKAPAYQDEEDNPYTLPTNLL